MYEDFIKSKIEELEKFIISNEIERRTANTLFLMDKSPTQDMINAKKNVEKLLEVYKIKLRKWKELFDENKKGDYDLTK